MLMDLWQMGEIPVLNAIFYRDGRYDEVDIEFRL